MTSKFRAARFLAAALLLAPVAHAQTLPTADEISPQRPDQPKWQAGIAGAALTLPDYPASDEYRSLALPAPYFVYRGRMLRSDDDEGSRLRQRLTPNVEIDVSGGGALSSDSGGSEARKGMPDLDYLVEVGPNLRLSFDGPAPTSKIVLNLPARGVASIGSSLQWQGVIFAPELAWLSQRFVDGRLSLRASIGTEFTTSHLQRYFYEAAPQYAIPDERPAYEASAGYLGASLGTRVSYDFTKRVRGFMAARYYNYSGAASEDSPLFRSDDGYSAVIGFSWTFFESKARAEE